MEEKKTPWRVLVLTRDASLTAMAQAILQPPLFSLKTTEDETAGTVLALSGDYDLVLLERSLPTVQEFCRSLASSSSLVLLFTEDTKNPALLETGTLLLPVPSSVLDFYGSMQQAVGILNKMKSVVLRNRRLEAELEEIRLVDRAKLLLMEHLGMTEEASHRFIGKEAMDRSLKRSEVAYEIIRTYQG